MRKESVDIIVIGGGPVGLFAAFYAGMRGMSVKIIESLPQLGGQLSALYPEKYIYDVAGFPKVRAQALVDGLVEQMNPFQPIVCLEEEVTDVRKDEDDLFNITTNHTTHIGKTILITAGNGAFQPRKMKVEREGAFKGTNIHYFVPDMRAFADKDVAIFGGGDSAVDWALMLEPIAKSVRLIHRREAFRAHEHSVELLKNSSVETLTPYAPIELIGADRVDRVVLQHVKTEDVLPIEVDDIIVNYGFVSTLGPIKHWGLHIEKNSIVVNARQETSIPGIYAAGDICTFDGKVKLIASGFGEAPTAVSNAKVYIDPKARVQPPHSTSIMGSGDEKAPVRS
ncbi:NAD(P)/FAD-dependent oxidoreductase [Shouchella sp. 1P09AA]|uniref:NAD(P)/FAD-dependent oxidoreductase n=1 Tax=unclassified Shouchella TaxID=2893065 RepID=UPI0039A079BB